MRCAISDLGVSPAMMVLGEQMQLPALLLEERPGADVPGSDLAERLSADFRTIRQYIVQYDNTLSGINVDIANPN